VSAEFLGTFSQDQRLLHRLIFDAGREYPKLFLGRIEEDEVIVWKVAGELDRGAYESERGVRGKGFVAVDCGIILRHSCECARNVGLSDSTHAEWANAFVVLPFCAIRHSIHRDIVTELKRLIGF
jgi:hypothetical protein